MVRTQRVRTLTLFGCVVCACALPTNNAPAPPDAGAGGPSEGGTGNTAAGAPIGGTSGSSNGGTTTGGAMTGGTTTGGTMTGGTGGTGGTMTGGSGGSMAGSTSGGAGSGGKGGTGGSVGGAGAGGKGGTAGTGGSAGSSAGTGGKGGTAGTGGSVGGAGTGGKGGTGGTGGTPGVLAHRYAFSGTGTTATDSIGGADGTITGGTQTGGAVTLAAEQYVTLPSTILSGLSATTLEMWVTWTGGTANWQRIFDFGSNDATMADQGGGNTASPYFFLTPRANGGQTNCTATGNLPRLAITPTGPTGESCVFGAATFPTGLTHAAVTIDASTMTLYINGAVSGTPVAPAASLSAIPGDHNWLGRSQFASDGEFVGSISEFRIYNVARSASQISTSRTAGPDSPPTQ